MNLPPEIMTKTSKLERSSDADLVKHIDNLNTKWMDSHEDSRNRLFESLSAFMDIEGGSWPQDELNDLLNADRHPTSINIARQKMDTLVGNLMAEEFDFRYSPLDEVKNPLLENIKYWYFADKEQYNYSHSESQCLLGGVLHAGYEEMYIDYKIRRTGGIGFRYCNDGTILEDPYWQTNDIKDWRQLIKHGWYTAQELIDKFETNDPEIKKRATLDELGGLTYDESDDIRDYDEADYNRGSKLLTIEYRWLEDYKTTRLYIDVPQMGLIPLPILDKYKNDEKEAIVRDFMSFFNVESWEQIREYPYEDQVLYYAICCPHISRYSILAKGKHPIQCGSLGVFPYSSVRMWGINKGIFEYILDLQRTLNYRHSKIDDVIASAAAGFTIVNEERVGGKKGIREIEEKKTRPDAVKGVQGNPNEVAALFPVGQVPEHLFREVNNIIDLFDRVSPVTPSLEGAGPKDESGVLFEMRHAASKYGTMRLYRNWQQHLMDKAEAWYNQAQIQYKGIYKKIPRSDIGDYIEFNVLEERNGQLVYINAIDQLPRAQVAVYLAKSSPTERFAKRAELWDITKMLSAHPDLFKNQIRFLTNDFMMSLDLDSKEKIKVERLAQMEEIRDIIGLMTEIKNLQAQGLNAEVMIKKLEAMMQQMDQPQAQQEMPEQISQIPRGQQ